MHEYFHRYFENSKKKLKYFSYITRRPWAYMRPPPTGGYGGLSTGSDTTNCRSEAVSVSESEMTYSVLSVPLDTLCPTVHPTLSICPLFVSPQLIVSMQTRRTCRFCCTSSYASVVLAVVILSVCHTRALWQNQCSADILVPHERAITLLFWQQLNSDWWATPTFRQKCALSDPQLRETLISIDFHL